MLSARLVSALRQRVDETEPSRCIGHLTLAVASPSSHVMKPMRQRDPDTNAAHIADAIVSTWKGIDAGLGPILGTRGVAALYYRSLGQTCAAYPWMASGPESQSSTIDLATLHSRLLQQEHAVAVAGGDALLQKFHSLLASLVGPSLAERLLRPMSADAQGSQPAQDAST